MKTEKPMKPMKHLSQILLAFTVLTICAAFPGNARAQSPPNINVSGNVNGDSVRRGRSAQAVVVMDIPSGFHVHSNRPLEKFLIATQLQIEAPNGVRIGSVIYPRPILRSLKFSKNRVAVFEGRTTMRFNVTVPASFGSDSAQLKAKLRYQSCNDELCFKPETKETWINVKVK
jgi:DsbC/DsbD-like thiol-disulfide interchange protein